MEFGKALVAKVDAAVVGRMYATLGFQLTGGHGEQYSPLIKKDGRTVEAPRFTVFDEGGKKIGAGKFEYG